MEIITYNEAYDKYLVCLQNTVLSYAIKSIDMNLFDIGFRSAEQQEFSLHIMCALTINRESKMIYYGDCDKIKFERDLLTMLGLNVCGVSLGEDNSLIVRFNGCSLEIVPADDGEESWRFFENVENSPHLVAADTWICSTGDGSVCSADK